MRSGTPLTASIPTDIPATLTAGDTWQWTKYVTDYSAADGWTLTYALRGASVVNVTATTDVDGAGFAVTVAATDTASVVAGVYQYLARVTLAGVVHTVDSGSVVILPNVATATAGTLQSHGEKMIALLKSEIQARIDGTGTGHTGYTIDGRSIEKFSLTELYTLLNRYRAELAREQNGGQLPAIGIRFTAVGS